MMTSRIESLIRRTANRFGVDIHRYRPNNGLGRLPEMLAHHGINQVLDIGANTGQFALALRAANYRGKIVSFEPLSGAYRQLSRAAAGDQHWVVAPQLAVGDRKTRTLINISENSVSSSTLPMLTSHIEAAPSSVYTSTEMVEQTTLDDALQEMKIDCSGGTTFLKIDTQGSEDRVLAGACGVLNELAGLQLELSFLPLYEGQKLFDQIDSDLIARNFNRWAITPVFSDARSGRMLQVDATYFRP